MEEEERPRKLQKIEHEPEEIPGNSRSLKEAPGGQNSEKLPASEDEIENEDDGIDGTAAVRTGSNASGEGLSKSQLKKLKKNERWEAGREFRKAKRKERRIARKERQKAAKAEGAASEGQDGDVTAKSQRGDLGKSLQAKSTLLPVTVIIDCAFDDLMTEKEIISLASQVTRAYSDNSRAPFRAHLAVSSFNKRLKERFDTVMAKTHTMWKGITITDNNFVAVAEEAKERMKGPDGGRLQGMFANKPISDADEEGEVIYLSSDSDETLTELKPYHTYIVGGLVDKNRHKGICYKSAIDNRVKTAKLPIAEYMNMASRYVLTTNHVVEIMIRWLELGDWGEAFSRVLPKRKGAVLKSKPAEVGNEADEDEQDIQEEGGETLDAEAEEHEVKSSD